MSFEHIILVYIAPMIVWVSVISVTLRLLVKKQAVSATLSWLMIIYLVPLIGVVAYLVFGEIKLGTKRAKAFKTLHPKYSEWLAHLSQQSSLVGMPKNRQYRPLFDLNYQRLGIPCIKGNELHILDTPESIIHHLIKDIRQAQYSINMVFYIWSNQGMIEKVSQALLDAKQRGVEIRILLDSVGSRPFLKGKACRALRKQGIEIVETLYVNLFRMFFSRIDLRQHRKIIVIDNQISYTGSMNMVDPAFFKQNSKVGNWVDIMVRVNGAVSAVLNSLHAWDWEIETGVELPLSLPNCPLVPIDDYDTHSVQVIATGPAFPDDLAPQSLALAIYAARQSIVITSPYFVPSHSIAEALRIVALRGVEVSIILPKKNDSLMVGWASRTFFDDLLAAGVKIYEFKAGLLHTKSVLIDNKLALVGTMNMDLRSFFLNFELALAVEDLAFANEVSILHESYIANSDRLDREKWLSRPFYNRIIERLFFLFSPLL
ncbi:cardiolipin synthase [Rodentibacter caecimuris]|uniref:Cardiolipin synthase A n=1 Tax=Rodentibacter caecimuris TaxID=1796644 RepID=A0AAJ3K320_9PAST|nr:cardiolipin synthase [Rodentibacter heylii]AOF52194.1 Cardiolipin synthetase [Pasteurellaceae bacterium NI1060]OOF71602.1 cardiolipin synthase [Rodentibacter heylii]OOF74856.1 cardiolipin synthase [Rodentibacter heylii]OOF77821.1 cardiolipin synthase [Rodentibacter heylii]